MPELQLQESLASLGKTYRTQLTHLAQVQPIWHMRPVEGGPETAVVEGIKVGGEQFDASPRFMQSFWTRFGQSPSSLSAWTPDELFGRLAEKHPRADFVLTTVAGRALAMSSPNSPRISPAMLSKLFQMPEIRNERGVRKLVLSEEGVVQTAHALPDHEVNIGDEGFLQEFLFETPIDGYGSPVGYLSLLRLVCLNGLIAYRPAFRSIFKIGGEGSDELVSSLLRVISSFANEEGFAALNQRFQKAMVTAPSVSEYAAFRSLLVQELNENKHIVAMLDLLDQKLGSISDMYSVASVTDLDPKRAKIMPMRGTMGDIINISTELTSHYPQFVRSPLKLHSWVGSLVQESYDLEDFKDAGDPKGDIAPRDRYLTQIFGGQASVEDA